MARSLCVTVCIALALGACKKKPATSPDKIAATSADGGASAPHWADLLGLGGGRGGPSATSKFSTYGKCVDEVERRLPPELGVVLPNYYDVPDAICRMRQALAEDNPTLCKKARTHTLRKGCETAYAIYRRKPDSCPLSYSARRGREAVCVALATRTPVLCLGARYEEEEVACRAILEGSIGDCRGLSASKRDRCETEVRRWKPLIKGPVKGSFPKGFEPTLELTLTSAAGGAAPLPVSKLSVDCAAAGAVAPSHGDTEQIVLCEMYSSRYRYGRRTSPYAHRVRLDLSFRPPRQPGEAIPFGQDARFRMRMTGGGTYESTGQGEVKVTRLERERGGRISGSFKVTVVGTSSRRGLAAEAEELTVQGTFDTFVRDLVDPAALRRGSRYRYGLGSRYGSGSRYGRLGSIGSGSGSGPASGSGSGPGAAGLLGTLRGLRGGAQPAERTRRFAAVLTAATLTEVNVGARKGLQVTSIVKDSLWERMGILEGDVVFQVGTVKLLRRADAVRVRAELRTRDRVAISVRRGKRNTSLTLTQPALQGIRDEFTL